MKITRDVVSDLWPLVVAGEASADTRALVDEFLRGDPEFAQRLAREPTLPPADLSMPPDAQARALCRTRELVRGGSWLLGVRLLAIALTALSILHFGKIAEAIGAGLAWIAYAVLTSWYRARALRGASQR